MFDKDSNVFSRRLKLKHFITENTENTSNWWIWLVRVVIPGVGHQMAALRLNAVTSSWCSLCGRHVCINTHTHTHSHRGWGGKITREGKQQRRGRRREMTAGRTEHKQLVNGLHVVASRFTRDQQFIHDGQFISCWLLRVSCKITLNYQWFLFASLCLLLLLLCDIITASLLW